MSTNLPLVSICIPTYNRAQKLSRAVESASNQDYENLEILVSDNASTDQTGDVIANYSRLDPRIRHIRREQNAGLIANFNDSIRAASGTYRMWLADDDWLDSNFVSAGVAVLAANPDLAMVAGECKIHREDGSVDMAREINISNANPGFRVIKYYATVTDNSGFYGLYRADVVTAIELIENKISVDWQFLAAVACMGRIITLKNFFIHRDGDTGASGNLREYARHFGLPKIFEYEPYLAAAFEAFNDISRDNKVYARYSKFGRASLALTVFCVIIFKKIILRRTYLAAKSIYLFIRKVMKV